MKGTRVIGFRVLAGRFDEVPVERKERMRKYIEAAAVVSKPCGPCSVPDEPIAVVSTHCKPCGEPGHMLIAENASANSSLTCTDCRSSPGSVSTSLTAGAWA